MSYEPNYDTAWEEYCKRHQNTSGKNCCICGRTIPDGTDDIGWRNDDGTIQCYPQCPNESEAQS